MKIKVNCPKCDWFMVDKESTYFDEAGTYTTRLAKCPYCGEIRVVEFIEDKSSLYVNDDDRYYVYH